MQLFLIILIICICIKIIHLVYDCSIFDWTPIIMIKILCFSVFSFGWWFVFLYFTLIALIVLFLSWTNLKLFFTLMILLLTRLSVFGFEKSLLMISSLRIIFMDIILSISLLIIVFTLDLMNILFYFIFWRFHPFVLFLIAPLMLDPLAITFLKITFTTIILLF